MTWFELALDKQLEHKHYLSAPGSSYHPAVVPSAGTNSSGLSISSAFSQHWGVVDMRLTPDNML